MTLCDPAFFPSKSPDSQTRIAGDSARDVFADGPTPCLHVFTDECTVVAKKGLGTSYETRALPLLRLSFDGREDARDDARARRILESFGALEIEALEDCAPAPGVNADYVLSHEGSAHDFCAFLTHVVPELRARGFRVTIDDAHAFKVVDAPVTFYAEVSRDDEEDEDEDPAWFSVELGLEVEGRRVPITATLLDMLSETSSLEGLCDLYRRARKSIAVSVAEGLYVALPIEKIRAILRVLAELYEWQHQRTARMGRLRVPKARACALMDLCEAFGGGPETISGDAHVLAYARALSQKGNDASYDAIAPQGLRAELRPYQRAGLAWLLRLRECGAGGVLADDMGLGKTLQTIAFLCIEKERGRLTKPALIVCPTSLVSNWAREAEKFAPHLRVAAYHGKDRKDSLANLPGADVIVTSYPVLTRDVDDLASVEVSTLVLDEAQTIKNEESRAHKTALVIRAEHRLCLTGTPVENNLGELFSIFDFAVPGLLGDELHFTRHFRAPVERDKNEERLAALRQLVAPYILRRTKAEVLRELPPKTESRCPVEVRGAQRDLYESIRVAAHTEVRRLIKTRGLAASTVPILGALMKLRQVCCDPSLVSLVEASRVGASAKREAFESMMRDMLRDGRRVLVFSQFTSMLSLLSKSVHRIGASHATITGATLDRAAEVDRFERGDVPVFLISLRAGGTGLTLTSADTVIHYDPWWNPAVQSQATDRAYRMGQKKPVFVHHLYVAGSVEERILRMQKKKKRVADAILGAGSADGVLTESDVEMLLSPLSSTPSASSTD